MLEETDLLRMKPRKAWHAISRAVREEALGGGFEQLPPAKQTVERLTELHAEVCNGGFSQYFTNSMGRHWREALEHLNVLGCLTQRDLLEQFVARLHQAGIDPADRDQVGRFVFGGDEEKRFEKRLNEEYYRHMDLFFAAVIRFALRHKVEFGIR